MKLWWQTLSARERGLLSVAACAVLATLIFTTLLEPLHTQRVRLAAQLAGETATLHKIRALAAEATRLREHPQQTGGLPPGQSLLAALNDSAQVSGIQDQLARVVPNGEAQASVTFNEVGFDTLITWLITLREQFGIDATRLVIDKTATPGKVNASLTLAAGA